jgi:thiamine kinase-like enzyme
MSQLTGPEEIIERVPAWQGRDVSYRLLHGGLANRSYLVTVDGERYVAKALNQSMDDFSLMIPVADVCRNTVAAGEAGVGARVLCEIPEVNGLVLEFIDGATLATDDLSKPDNITRLGRAVRRLHQGARPFGNEISIWAFLDDYLALAERHALPTPEGLLELLPLVQRARTAIAERRPALVPSHNDLLPLNIMDDGEIRLIDYDFSGLNDPCFDLGDLAMEGDFDPDQLARLCEAYFGGHEPVAVARAGLLGIAAQYTWALLFVGMHYLLTEAPAEGFDYLAEAESRWAWARAKLSEPGFGVLIDRSAGR